MPIQHIQNNHFSKIFQATRLIFLQMKHVDNHTNQNQDALELADIQDHPFEHCIQEHTVCHLLSLFQHKEIL